MHALKKEQKFLKGELNEQHLEKKRV